MYSANIQSKPRKRTATQKYHIDDSEESDDDFYETEIIVKAS
jgi:hypothetical protein